MKKKHFLMIVAVFCIVLMVSGAKCSIGKKDPDKEIESTLKYGTDIYKGTEGLVVKFAKDVPPKRVFSNEPLIVVFEIYNKGAKTVEPGEAYLYFSGADPSIVKLNENWKQLPKIEGKEEILGEGGYDTVTFQTTSEMILPRGTDVYKPRLVGTVCYKYQTIASPVICLDPNPFGTFTGDRACKIRDVSTMGGQGAPIAVTKIEQRPMKGATQLKIHIKNTENRGKTITANKFRTCTQVEPQDYNSINKLDGYDITIGNKNAHNTGGITTGTIDCKPETVRLVDDKAIIICKYVFQNTNLQAFSAPVVVKLDYHYIESTKPYEIDILNIGPIS